MKESNTNNVNESGYQMFRTGSGKPVVVNQSSLSKASAILGDVLLDQGLYFLIQFAMCIGLHLGENN